VPLRQIFDDVCRSSANTGQQITFADLEGSMYKRRRKAQPALPTTPAEADEAVRSSRYVELNDGDFYRGVAEAGENGSALAVRCPKKKVNMLQDKRIKSCPARYDSGAYSRQQFLLAVSHSMGAHTEAFRHTDDPSSSSSDGEDAETEAPTASTTAEGSASTAAEAPDSCDVCMVAPRERFALVPCGHARFCESCAFRVAELGAGCPVCRSPINMVIRLFS